jgi:hypothetical protein
LKDTAGKLRKLKKQEVDRFMTSTNSEDMQNQTCNVALQVPTRVDLPLGELANPEMSELIKDLHIYSRRNHASTSIQRARDRRASKGYSGNKMIISTVAYMRLRFVSRALVVMSL